MSFSLHFTVLFLMMSSSFVSSSKSDYECKLLVETNRCLLKDVACSYECVKLESEELVSLIRDPLEKYHKNKILCKDKMAIPTCSNNISGACDHVDNCTLPRSSKIASVPKTSKNTSVPKSELTARKLSLARILKFDDINTLLGCATIDVATAMEAEGGFVVDYTSESCTGETCAPSWLGGGCCCNLCAGLRAQVWDMPCSGFQFGDITISLLSSTSTTYKLRLGFSSIQASCS